MLKVKFKKMRNNAKLPVKGSLQAACYDVYASEVVYDDKNPRKRTVKLGFATEIPKGYHAVIVPRSNLSKHYWMLGNSIGIIDSDYRGEWMAVFTNITDNAWTYPFPYEVGERVAQIYFEKNVNVQFEETDELSDTARGEGGFGSTGLI